MNDNGSPGPGPGNDDYLDADDIYANDDEDDDGQGHPGEAVDGSYGDMSNPAYGDGGGGDGGNRAQPSPGHKGGNGAGARDGGGGGVYGKPTRAAAAPAASEGDVVYVANLGDASAGDGTGRRQSLGNALQAGGVVYAVPVSKKDRAALADLAAQEDVGGADTGGANAPRRRSAAAEASVYSVPLKQHSAYVCGAADGPQYAVPTDDNAALYGTPLHTLFLFCQSGRLSPAVSSPASRHLQQGVGPRGCEDGLVAGLSSRPRDVVI